MEQQRNPYEAPKAPLFADSAPKALPTEADMIEYAGFWRRLGAILLDILILAPMAVCLMIGLSFTHRAYLYYALPSLLVYTAYYVYLVQRFGGTPGKRILGMRIALKDGSPITTKAAFVRYLPLLALTILSMLANTLTALSIGESGFDGLSYFEKMQAMQSHMPAWSQFIKWASSAWWIATAITLVANTRKRAIHDFLAGTVVLREG